MKIRYIIYFLLILFSLYGVNNVQAYWIKEGGEWRWSTGQVLGTSTTNQYVYVIKSKKYPSPTSTIKQMATQTPILTNTIIPSATLSPHEPIITVTPIVILSPFNSPPSPTPTPTPTPTLIPTPTPLYCGSAICSASQVCYSNVCRQQCGPGGECPNNYICRIAFYNGVNVSVCIPGSGWQAPTITPYPTQRATDTSSSSSSSPPTATPTMRPTYAPEPTNIYPTRSHTSYTVYTNPGSPPPAPVPQPKVTDIPTQLKGKNSTIVIELPSPPSINPLTPTPKPQTLVIKGEEMKDIIIDVFKPASARAEEPQQSVTQNTPAETSPDLNILLEKKQGTPIAINQQEFVIQKGSRFVTITSNSQNVGSLTIGQNETKATVSMPISINPTTNIMTVDTPSGPMKVSMMPDDVVAIIKQLKVIDPTGTPSSLVLQVRNNQLEYKIQAGKMEKLLWVMPITIQRDIYVSADTGGVIEIKKAPLYEFLSLFTF